MELFHFLQSQETTPVVVGAFAFFLLFVITFLVWKFSNASITGAAKNPPPPEAGFAWPIIGHLHLLGGCGGGSKLPHLIFSCLADKFGPAFIFRLGKHPTLVVSDGELVKELFSTNDLIVLDRPKVIAGEHLAYDNAMFGLSEYGPYWREIRKIVSLELFSARRIRLLQHIRVSETEASMKELYKVWDEERKVSSSSFSGFFSTEVNKWFENLTMNVILRMVAGKSCCGSVDARQDEEARRCQEVLRELFHLFGVFLVSDSIPWLRWLDLGGYEKKMKAVRKDLDYIVGMWLKERRLRREDENDRKVYNGDHQQQQQDFMDVMISLMEGAEIDAGYDGDTIIKATCINLLAGGSDTTSGGLTMALALLMNNRHVLRTAREELDHRVGKERMVEESDIKNLVYLQAIIKETLRLYPPSAIGGMRVFKEKCTLGGYHIPRGTRLVTNLWKLHRDPNVFEEPLEFKPERFLTANKDLDVKGKQFELIPFGSGRRICPGMNFGLLVLQFVLASFLHAFDFATPSDEAVDMSQTMGLINHKATPLKLLVAPRLPSYLYF